MARSELRIRLVCDTRPPERRDGVATEFGLQDKARALLPGTIQADGSLRFDCEIGVEPGTGHEELQLSGPFVHGKPGERFLYLGWRPRNGAVDDWIRRWKISLNGISAALIGVLSVNVGLLLRCKAYHGVWIDSSKWQIFEFDRGAMTAAVA